MNNEQRKLVEFAQGDVYLWVEADSSIMLKAISRGGDAVELGSGEARELGETLIKIAAKIL
jgi:hypothetical protein